MKQLWHSSLIQVLQPSKPISSLLLLAFLFILIAGCKKNGPNAGATLPTVETSGSSTVTVSTIEAGISTVTSDGGSPVTARGLCWSSTGIPTIADNKTNDGSGTGPFSTTLTGLAANTMYTYRAYATNSVGTGYGDPKAATTSIAPVLATVTASGPSVITSHAAVVSVQVTADGNSPVTASGVCWSTSPNPTTSNNKTVDGAGIGYYSTTIENLTVNKLYYFRAYATNGVGTAYSTQISFATAYILGELSNGGRVFYIDNTKIHGLVAALSDPVSGATWQPTNSSVFLTANAFSYSNGLDNTTRIVNAFGTAGTAAAVCWNYTNEGYTDWYLPSINELSKLMSFQQNQNFNLQSGDYWSSTENSSYIAWSYTADYTAVHDAVSKVSLRRVRPIRAF